MNSVILEKTPGGMFLHRLGKVRAPEFPKGLVWLNSEPLLMKKLLGKPVLIDFWTYSCVNCQRTLPHVRRWWKSYQKKGLTIIGVHTPEFEFEHDQENVEQAIRDGGIDYPIILDNDYKIWNLYANRWWPRKFLVDAKGNIVYDHIGEGAYSETEMAIQEALTDIGVKELPAVAPDISPGGGVCYRTTPETYLGFVRGRFGNVQAMESGVESAFTDGTGHTDDLVYLHGHWVIDKDSVSHTRTLSDATEFLSLRYSAFSVNLVMRSTNGKSSMLEVELDGKPLPKDMAGSDVRFDADGRALVNVKEARMYRLVNADAYHHGTLRLKTAADNLECFAFTFGGCAS